MEKHTGTVKFYNTAKGFGFIKEDGKEKDIFMHSTGVIGRVQDNDKVEFEIQDTPKGPAAVNVKVID